MNNVQYAPDIVDISRRSQYVTLTLPFSDDAWLFRFIRSSDLEHVALRSVSSRIVFTKFESDPDL